MAIRDMTLACLALALLGASAARASESFVQQALSPGLVDGLHQISSNLLLAAPVAPQAVTQPQINTATSGNAAQLVQVGYANSGMITQAGAGNAAVLMQQGSNNTAVISQTNRAR